MYAVKGVGEQALRLKKLIQANQMLARVESLDALLPMLLRLAQDVADAVAASILLYDKSRGVLEFALVVNDELGEAARDILKKKIVLPLGQGLAGWVGQNKTSVIVQDAQCDPRFNKQADKATGFVTRSLLCIPVLHNDQLLGVVQVLNSKTKAFFDEGDLELLESFGHLAAVALVRSDLLRERLAQQKFESQLEAASKIQSQFRPVNPDLGNGAVIWGHSASAMFVGGDLYDFIPLADGSWVVYVADVSGKGLPAALIMAALWPRIRAMAADLRSPGSLLEAVNGVMFDIMAGMIFTTIVLARIWPDTGRCRLALGGHLQPLRIGAEGLVPMPWLAGVPLGIIRNATYGEEEIVLGPGESLLFLTDGVTEARNGCGEFFGDERLEDEVRVGGVGVGQRLVDAVERFRAGADPNDDVTVVEIGCLGSR